jgi:hypothetical protein
MRATYCTAWRDHKPIQHESIDRAIPAAFPADFRRIASRPDTRASVVVVRACSDFVGMLQRLRI